MSKTKYESALDVVIDSDAGKMTVREYLLELLLTLWDKGESFSGKRPFGNSGWQYDLYDPLVKNGFIPGTMDDDGYVSGFDEDDAWFFVEGLIYEAFNKKQSKGKKK